MLVEPVRDRRSERRAATKAEILDAAWEIARTDGLAAVSLRDIARRVGMQPPSIYNYFASKNAIYDAMYEQGCHEFNDAAPWQELTGDARHDLAAMVRYYVEFCAEDPARHQLLFQRTIPGFEPSPESFAVSEAGLALAAEHLRQCGLDDPRALDLFTALGAGLADQQLANDPGGDRWTRLVDDAVEMFVDYLTKNATTRSTTTRKGRRSR